MKTKTLITILVGFLVISVVAGTTSIAASDKANGKPEEPGDRAKAPDLEKIEFIHWKKDSGKARPPCNNNGTCEPELGEKGNCADCKNGDEDPTTTCYAFMGQYGKKYLKWRDPLVDFVINPTDVDVIDDPVNPDQPALTEDFVTYAISAGASEWDYFTLTDLFDLPAALDYSATYRVQDYVNAVCFDDYYLDPDIIGACTVWYSPATKTIVEFDITFETNYIWGDATVNAGVMDLQNIATHELGHALGLADVYEAECSEVTMYGYSGEGDTGKRDLAEADVIGILLLYPD